ncbi:hypothetical protein D3C78_1362620 [compost metagenome]
MTEQGMILIAGELLGRELPVAVNYPLLHATDNFGAAFPPIQQTIQIPGHITQILFEWRSTGIPVAKYQAFIAFDTRHFLQPPMRFAQALWIGARLQWHLSQFAIDAIRPAVIRAGKSPGIATVRVADTHRAMATLVEKRFDGAIFLADNDDCVFPHVSVKEIAWFWYLAFMGQKQPATAKYPLQF